MSWHETGKEKERLRFFYDWKSRKYSMSELCQRYKISRKTGYKFVNRVCSEGELAVRDRSRARLSYPNQTNQGLIYELLQTKVRYRHWGPAKIRAYLQLNSPDLELPSTSTVGAIFKRHGLVKPRNKRRKVQAHTEPLKHCDAPNSVWSVDFKGQFKLSNGRYCYPLTISDNYSRYLLCCEGLQKPTLENCERVFINIFKRYGLPEAIRSDNGQPFAGLGIGGLTRLSSWWIKLGIQIERIAAGHPEQNGRHERMHRTLKQATANPPQVDEISQQEVFDKFIYEYNNERPHEALSNARPMDIYQLSSKRLPERMPAITYPKDYLVRRVRSNGEMKLQGKKYYVSDVLIGESIGLKLTEKDRYIIYFSSKQLGIIDARKEKIERL